MQLAHPLQERSLRPASAYGSVGGALAPPVLGIVNVPEEPR